MQAKPDDIAAITQLESALADLYALAQGLIFDLRYDPRCSSGPWVLMEIKYPNRPEVVPGTFADNPVHAVNLAISRWNSRSTDDPF